MCSFNTGWCIIAVQIFGLKIKTKRLCDSAFLLRSHIIMYTEHTIVLTHPPHVTLTSSACEDKVSVKESSRAADSTPNRCIPAAVCMNGRFVLVC